MEITENEQGTAQFARVGGDENRLERMLFLAVIRRAQNEADGMYLWDEEDTARFRLQYRARRWLITRSRSYHKVCELAGLLPAQAEQLQALSRRTYGSTAGEVAANLRNLRVVS